MCFQSIFSFYFFFFFHSPSSLTKETLSVSVNFSLVQDHFLAFLLLFFSLSVNRFQHQYETFMFLSVLLRYFTLFMFILPPHTVPSSNEAKGEKKETCDQNKCQNTINKSISFGVCFFFSSYATLQPMKSI